MESMAARTDGGTYSVVIERDAMARLVRVELHVSFTIPNTRDDTVSAQEVLRSLAQQLDCERAPELMARMYTLATELEDQDRGRKLPGNGGA